MIIDTKKSSDTGQAMTLICLVVYLLTSSSPWLIAAMVVLVVNMACPIVYKPLGYLWFGLAHVMGLIVSKIILTLVFVFLVVPVGLVRSWCGSDPMRLREWKKKNEEPGSDSVFVQRNHLYQEQDIIAPY